MRYANFKGFLSVELDEEDKSDNSSNKSPNIGKVSIKFVETSGVRNCCRRLTKIYDRIGLRISFEKRNRIKHLRNNSKRLGKYVLIRQNTLVSIDSDFLNVSGCRDSHLRVKIEGVSIFDK